MLALLQKRLIYFPARASEADLLDTARRNGLEPWRNASGTLIGWRSPVSGSPEARLVVFHGNAGFALHRDYFVDLPPPGWEVLLFEYPGYGCRPGPPGERVIKAAALDALEEISTSEQEAVYLAGESIGTGVAAWLAGQRPQDVAGVLLITPMTSLTDVAAHHYPFLPVRWLLRERYDSMEALRAFSGPAAFVVAGRDEVIPTKLGRELFETYGGRKRIWEQPKANHNSLDFAASWWEPVFALLREDG